MHDCKKDGWEEEKPEIKNEIIICGRNERTYTDIRTSEQTSEWMDGRTDELAHGRQYNVIDDTTMTNRERNTQWIDGRGGC